MKVCPKCGENKPFTDYWRRKEGRPTGYCKPCAVLRLREWRESYPEYGKGQYKKHKTLSRERTLLKKYGIDLATYQSLMAGQSGRCAICREPEKPDKAMAVDHCHGCGEVRGLLCKHCNLLLGTVKDDPGYLSEAIAYLAKGCGC